MNYENNANRKYKDTVFTKLFGEKDKLAELYNAIHETNYTPDDIVINTLENVIFAGMINDISFTLDGRLIILIEHQSSVNPNMPVRFLLYVARIYEMLIDSRAMYSSRIVDIMSPEFIVMYNGKDEYPEESILKLSDAFIDKNVNSIELLVKVYNVNNGHNPEIMSRSGILNEYAIFVARVRENIDNGFKSSEAMEKAVKDCIRDNILKEFLEKYGSDVINMLSLEFNLEDAKRVWKNDGIEEGIEKGIEQGIEQGKEQKAEEIAISLLDILDVKTIAEKTKLSIKRIKELKQQHESKE